MSDERLSPGATDAAVAAGEVTRPEAFPNIEADGNGATRHDGHAANGGGADAAKSDRLDLVLDVPVRLSVELGRAEVPIRDVVNLGRGSVIELDRALGEPLDVRVNGVLIGRGEIVVVNEERLGMRFVEIVSQTERATRLG